MTNDTRARRLASLSPAARARLIAKVKEARRDSLPSKSVATVRRLKRTGAQLLSHAQERLWFLDQLEPESPFYSLPAAFVAEGPGNITSIVQVLSESYRRHQGLRITFATDGGRPRQITSAPCALAVPQVELGGLSADAREEVTRRLMGEEARRPFSLTTGPLIRGRLLRQHASRHLIILNTHHIATDGWSTGLLVREVVWLHGAYVSGAPSPLGELSIQYADYSAWQRRWLSGDELERQTSYWRGQLAGAPPVLELPTDRPRPAVLTYRGATKTFAVPPELNRLLAELSQREGATPFMTLMAAFQVLLSRLSGQDDISVGTQIAGRRHRELEKVVGFFVNALVMRVRLGGKPTFRDVLGRVRETALGAFGHQDLPFEKLVEKLQPERSMSYSSLFQVHFAFENAPGGGLEIEGLTLTPLAASGGVAKFDLSWMVWEQDGGLGGLFEYSTDLFDGTTITRISSGLRNLLRNIVRTPDAPLESVSLLTEAEQHECLSEWQVHLEAMPALADSDNPVVERLSEMAALRRDKTAIVCGEFSMSYRDLDLETNRVADLVAGTVPYGSPVGVFVGERVYAIIALLGILKAGRVFVPLSRSAPEVRLAQTIEEAGAELFLGDEDSCRLFMRHKPDAQWVTWTQIRLAETTSANPKANGRTARAPRIAVDPDAMCYVYFTSGSTGRPKGVSGRLRGLLQFVEWEIETFGVDDTSRVSQLITPAFDAFLRDVLVPLNAGGTVCVPPDNDVVLDSAALARWLNDANVTLVHCVPSVLRILLDAELHPEMFPSLRHVLTSGEPLLPADVERWTAVFGQRIQLVNFYGATETTMIKLFHLVDSRDASRSSVPIGKPMGGACGIALSSGLQPTAIGEVGELYIRTPFRSLGYFGRPEETAKVFVPDPLAADSSSIVYRTGDLVRRVGTGEYQFVGRADDLVKIRGNRIELGDIQSALRKHDNVRDAVVVVSSTDGDEARLCGYVLLSATVETESRVTDQELRKFVAQRLPSYMVPARVMIMESFPLLATGKVDRKSLPEPEGELNLAEEYVAPRNPTEEVLADIWSELLNVDRVGVHDNFFDLGGHSLMATRVASRILQSFGVRVTLRALFEAQTIAEVALLVDVISNTGTESTAEQEKFII